jgi:hypothetical protein
MAGATGKRHVVLLFTVLAGLFLMHGLSAPSMHGMPMPMPMPVPAPGPAAMATSMAAPMPASEAVSTPVSTPVSMQPQADVPTVRIMPIMPIMPIMDSIPAPMSDPMQGSMTCVPLRPEGLAGLFVALFLIVMMPWRPRLSFPARLIHPHRPHGPPRTGVQILHALSISRT